MRISDWSSDVCSSDLHRGGANWTNWSGHCANTVPDSRRFRPRSGEISMNFRPFAAACLASVLLAACSTVPQPLLCEFNQITPREPVELYSTGAPVRWGGRIAQVEPKQTRTCFRDEARRIREE